MNEGLVKLREVGAQKIYEKTHIPVEHVQAILHESYDGLNKVQFIGFISILEREYGLDLKSVKLQGITHFDGEQVTEEESIFIQPKPKRNKKLLLIIIAAIVFFLFFFVFYDDSQKTVKPTMNENEVIQKVKEKVIEEVNNTKSEESNETVAAPESVEEAAVQEEPAVQEEVVEKSFVIKTNKKLWIGYIELETNKKSQTVFSKEFSLDPNKDWLITLGHGYVDFEVNGKEHSYKTPKGLKFLYRDGELTSISLEEFKRLNRGYVW